MSEKEIRENLLEELSKSDAPVTGIHVACGLLTKKGYYFGHNRESQNPPIFEHAENMALTNAIKAEIVPQIIEIYSLGGGEVVKLKQITPCFACASVLSNYANPDTSIHLLANEKIKSGLDLKFGEAVSCYGDLPYSVIEGKTAGDIHSELKNKTLLEGNDLDFIADLRLFGIEADIKIFLTGSSTGRGGVSTLIMSKTGEHYRDIDLIFVVQDKVEGIRKNVEDIIQKHYLSFKREERSIPDFKNKDGVLISQHFYRCGLDDKKVVDITFSLDFAKSFTYKEYQLKNWFHQIS